MTTLNGLLCSKLVGSFIVFLTEEYSAMDEPTGLIYSMHMTSRDPVVINELDRQTIKSFDDHIVRRYFEKIDTEARFWLVVTNNSIAITVEERKHVDWFFDNIESLMLEAKLRAQNV